MKVPETEDLIVHPSQGDLTEAVLRSYVEQWIDDNPLPPLTWRAKAKLTFGWLVHPLGHHTWVRWRQWDHNTRSFLDFGFKCRYCPRGRVR